MDVLCFFRDLYAGVPCIVRQLRVGYFHRFDQRNLVPEHAEAEITLEEIVSRSVSYSEVRG